MRRSGPGEREMRMPAMRQQEQNPEAYLAVFEQAAASSRLPRGEWGARLATLLSDDAWAEETYPVARSPATPDYYDALKAKILSQARAAEDQSRLDFLSVRYDPVRGARDLGRRLDSAAKRWLRPQHRTAAQVEQQVAMEQFVSLLPKEAGSWVHRQHPRDLEEAIRLAEQRLSPSNEEDTSPAGATTVTQTDASDREPEAGETGKTKRHRNCDQTGVKENITESFLNKLDTVKLESVNFSLDIPDLEVIYLDDEGMEENPALKQEVSEPGFPRATEIPDREGPTALPQGPLVCTQEPRGGGGVRRQEVEDEDKDPSVARSGPENRVRRLRGERRGGRFAAAPASEIHAVPGPAHTPVARPRPLQAAVVRPPAARLAPLAALRSVPILLPGRHGQSPADGQGRLEVAAFPLKLGAKRGVAARRHETSSPPALWSQDKPPSREKPPPRTNPPPLLAATGPTAARTAAAPSRSFHSLSDFHQLAQQLYCEAT
ncbi:hypothetical protein AAFF_G00216430 [Aldrovandia affinis]|uniref:SCAN box domain-containing protein n=1 Tax=Aldrovandia affinis TaxID=143900 RepID=A0AAD7RGI9_9TELE|nr:hypothetical protein AAFF_G00216430 [Aldrovandia affinis]